MNYRESAQEWAIRHRWMHSGLLSTLVDIMEMPKHVLSNSTDDGNHLLDLLGHYLQSFVVCVDKWRDSHPIFPCRHLMRSLNSFLILPSQPTTIGMTCPMYILMPPQTAQQHCRPRRQRRHWQIWNQVS